MLDGLTRGVKDVFISSTALDHFSPSAVERLAARGKIRVFGSSEVCREISSLENAEVYELQPFSPIRTGELSILPLPAIFRTDNRGECAFNFLVECEGRTFFYGIDGAWIHPETLPFLKGAMPDAFILDCAVGDLSYCPECSFHNNFEMVRSIIQLLRASGAVKDGARFILSHLPTDKRASAHDELSAIASELGARVAYDGYFLGI